MRYGALLIAKKRFIRIAILFVFSVGSNSAQTFSSPWKSIQIIIANIGTDKEKDKKKTQTVDGVIWHWRKRHLQEKFSPHWNTILVSGWSKRSFRVKRIAVIITQLVGGGAIWHAVPKHQVHPFSSIFPLYFGCRSVSLTVSFDFQYRFVMIWF